MSLIGDDALPPDHIDTVNQMINLPSNGISPRLKLGGTNATGASTQSTHGLSSLENVHARMNRTLAELKDGRFEHAKGFEALQTLQVKLLRLQNGFDLGGNSSSSSAAANKDANGQTQPVQGPGAENIASVQQSLIEYSAFYATNPVVLSGMVKLTEVLGLANVALTAKAEEVRVLLETYLEPLEKRYQNLKSRMEGIESEVSVYRSQISKALEQGSKHEKELSLALAGVKDNLQVSVRKEVEKKQMDLLKKNQELSRKVRELEFQLKKRERGDAMKKSLNAASNVLDEEGLEEGNTKYGANNGSSTGPSNSNLNANSPHEQIIDKIYELENLVNLEQGELLAPMIRDALNYLRTLLLMKGEGALTGGGGIPGTNTGTAGGSTNAAAAAILNYPESSGESPTSSITSSTRPVPLGLKPNGNLNHNVNNLNTVTNISKTSGVTTNSSNFNNINNFPNSMTSNFQAYGHPTTIGSSGMGPVNSSLNNRKIPSSSDEPPSVVFSAPRLG